MSVLSRPVGFGSLIQAARTLILLTITQKSSAQTEAFTDPATGINFQRFFGAKTSFGFGVALPQNPSTDFIGRFDVRIPDGQGYAGIALQDDMVDPLLIVAWPNGNKVVSSFRVAENEDDSPPAVQGDFKILEIPDGTSVNDTHMIFTFLCQNCLDNGDISFSPEDTSGKFSMGWALADRPVSDPADPAATLPFHNVGFDEFDATLSQARDPLFGEWAQLAGDNVVSNGSTTAVPIDPPGQETGGGDDDDSDEDSAGSGDEGDDSDSDGDSAGSGDEGDDPDSDDDDDND